MCAHVDAETCGADRQAGRQAGRRSHFSECAAAVLSVHSFTVPVHCSLIMARPHSGSAPLLSPPGCPSVHLRGRLCGLAAADHSLMISKNNCGSISHTRTRGSKRFSKLLILLLANFVLSFFAIIFFSPSFCARHFLRKDRFYCKFKKKPKKTNQHAVNRLSFIFAESVLDAYRLNIFIRVPSDTNRK